MTKTVLEIVEIVVLVTVVLCALVGNCLIILAFIVGSKTVKTLRNYFIVNLAVADLMVVCLSLPLWIVSRIDVKLIHDAQIAKYFSAFDVLCGTTSILNLAAISLERMYAVNCPVRHFNLTPLPVLLVIAATWTIGFLLTAAKFVINIEKSNREYTVLLFVLAYLVPVFVIIVSYFIIYCYAISKTKGKSRCSRLKRDLKAAKTISVIIGLFILCWSPFFFINILYVFEIRSTTNVINISKLMHYSNSMMNFFVYGLRSRDFKRSFQSLLKCS
ncbi:octopamine receptor 1 isoform X2 [Hydra vulgaris]|uniref:Octopamine receptor 1 isoform X2 n=3 Tax=Hydra vulgaris TaxID=6087 RepID=A0ABM4BRT4_HYDVU|nr:octopamine receptor 1 isoform X2 [Hydra vulgaris]